MHRRDPERGQDPVEDVGIDRRVLGNDQLHPQEHQLDRREGAEAQRGPEVEDPHRLVVRAGRSLDPGGPATRDPLGDDLGAGRGHGGGRGHGRGSRLPRFPRPFPGRPPGPRQLLPLLPHVLLVGGGADHAHPGAHHRVGAPREEGRLPRVDALAVGPEPGLGGLAGDRVDLAAERGDEPPVHDVGRGEPEDDRGVHGHHELAVGEHPVARARRPDTRTATATAARSR